MKPTPSAIREKIRNLRLEIRRLKLLEKMAQLEAAKRVPPGSPPKPENMGDAS